MILTTGKLDRHRMHQEQFSLHAKEFDDLTKQNQKLFDQWTRVDIECSRTVEDLQITNGRIKQSRNECANLRAEKKIWEVRRLPCLTWSCVSIICIGYTRPAGRGQQDACNGACHLSDLMSNVQKMHNNLEHSRENDRCRLENQLQTLAIESQT